MSDTLESLQRRKESANELASVVRTMKAMAAANIGQYELAVTALQDYYNTVLAGLHVCFHQQPVAAKTMGEKQGSAVLTGVLVFGSDQGLVGRFNDLLVDVVLQKMQAFDGAIEAWTVGERVYNRLTDAGLPVTNVFAVPNAVGSITKLVNEILIKSEESREEKQMEAMLVFHNRPRSAAGYEPVSQRLLPLDETWEQESAQQTWPSKNRPQVIGKTEDVLPALLREYLFVSLYKACAESLASENRSRLEAMQHAEKNIGDMLNDLNQAYNHLRQSTIDEELFDVVAGFEALKKNQNV